jgi:hypothetical protein
VAGQLRYEKCKLFGKPEDAAVVPKATLLFDDVDDLLPKPFLVTGVQ